MDKFTPQIEEKIQALFHSLLGNKKIASVEFFPKAGIPTEMIVVTAPLRVLYRDYFFWIDPMKIVVKIESRTLTVHKSHSKQKVGRIDGWLAPHVRSNGTVCCGNMERDVRAALQNQNWPLAIEFIICLLESCTPQSVYTDTLKDVATRIEKA